MKPTPSDGRISLAEASRATGALMRRGDPSPLGSQEHPQLADITECLFFSPGDGRIWLNDQRMVLMHTASLGALRRELIDSLGLERARGLLTRAGYESGGRRSHAGRTRCFPGRALPGRHRQLPMVFSQVGLAEMIKRPPHFAPPVHGFNQPR